jgi:prepilin-type N-terminal cleavage/methylation domain-containing protein
MGKPRSEGKSSTGFTLLEVVVAMTIVGLGVVTLLEIFSLGLRLGVRSSETSESLTYGRQAMDEVLIRRKVEVRTEESPLGEKRRWRLQIQPVQQEASSLPLSQAWELREVALELDYRDRGRQKRLELRTLRLVKGKNP